MVTSFISVSQNSTQSSRICTSTGNRIGKILPYSELLLFSLCAVPAIWCLQTISRWASRIRITKTFDHRLIGLILVHSLLVILLAHARGLYSGTWKRSFRQELWGLSESVLSASLVTGLLLFLADARTEAYWIAATTAVMGWLMMASWRRFLHTQSIPGMSEKKNVVIVGGGKLAQQVRQHIEENPELGFNFAGFVDRRASQRPGEVLELEHGFIGSVQELPAIIRAHFVDEVFICVPSDKKLVREVSQFTRAAGVSLRVIPDIFEDEQEDVMVAYVGQFPTMHLQEPSIPTFQLLLKRLFDIVVSFVLLLLLSPVMGILAVLVRATSKGPVLYKSLRVGRKGRTFVCFKYRTMVANAESLKSSLMHLNERDGVLFKISNDPRITALGRIFRKYSLDELPQLWNVLTGDMSLVGPRPPVPTEYRQYALEHLRRLDVTPGVTGLWQVTARQSPSFSNYLHLDREYIETWSLWLDCKILWRTIGVTFAGTGQ